MDVFAFEEVKEKASNVGSASERHRIKKGETSSAAKEFECPNEEEKREGSTRKTKKIAQNIQ